MKIAQVSPLYESVPPKLYGGTERVVSFLTEELVKQGNDVTLFASGDSVTNATLIPCCDRSLRLNEKSQDHLAHHLLMLEKVIKQIYEFDIIHYHIDYLHFPISRIYNSVPQVTTLHGRLSIPDLVPLFTEYKEMPVISISQSQREPLPWLNWQGTVYHGLPADLFTKGNGGGGYLAFLGRISPEKRLDRAIELALRCDIPIRIAAKIDDGDVDYYERKIKPMLNHPLVEYIGEIREQEKQEFLGNAIGLLFPIEWAEPFGLVMIEAMACGTPVIAYDHGSVSELIVNGKSGFIIHSQEEGIEAINNLPKISRLDCRLMFEENFTVERMTHDYLSLYTNVINRKSKDNQIKMLVAR